MGSIGDKRFPPISAKQTEIKGERGRTFTDSTTPGRLQLRWPQELPAAPGEVRLQKCPLPCSGGRGWQEEGAEGVIMTPLIPRSPHFPLIQNPTAEQGSSLRIRRPPSGRAAALPSLLGDGLQSHLTPPSR